MLSSLIKKAHKVITGDAVIFDNAFQFLQSRINADKKTLYIKNNFNKFQNVPAVRVRNENEFINKLMEQVKNKQPFLCGCDSASLITDWMNKCKALVGDDEEEKAKFILVTADTNIEIHNAEEQFKGKYVFYSPKITYGVDFSIDTSQNVYIYQEGKSIMPNGTFQQTTRCRNIETLYYYSECKYHDDEYVSLDDVKQTLTENVKYFREKNMQLYNASTTYNEDEDKFEVIENNFFNLYCYTEYINDTYKTNMTKHYEDLLRMNGFILSEEGKPKKIDKQNKEDMKAVTEKIREDLFNEFLEAEDKKAPKFDTFNKHIEFLNIPRNNEMYNTYKAEIMDKHLIQDHLNVIRLLKTDDYIEDKLRTAKSNSYDVKNMTMIYSKVKAIRDLETKYNIEPLNINYDMKGEIDMSEGEYKYIKNIFRITRAKPRTYEDLRKVYATMLRHVTNGDLITSKQEKKTKGGKRDATVYDIDHNIIKYHLELNKFSNPNCSKFHEHFITKYNIQPKSGELTIDQMCDLLDVII